MNTSSQIELLESRIAPASLVLIDADGDKVKFTTSKGDLAGLVTETTVPGVGTVFSVNISGAEFAGTNLTVSVSKSKTGDGIAVIGAINAGSNDLGVVKIKGDLGDIDAGSGSATVPAIRSLAVDSIGRFGVFGTGDNATSINGDVGAISVKRDFSAATVVISGDVRALRVGGSVIGSASGGGGTLYATSEIGSVIIKGDLRGGDHEGAGSIGAGLGIGSVTIRGSIYGGSSDYTGQVFAGVVEQGRIGKVTVKGSVFGGAGFHTGAIGGQGSAFGQTQVSLGKVLIGGDLLGGTGQSSGKVEANEGSIDSLVIKGSFVNGPALGSGVIRASLDLHVLTIHGSILGGFGGKGARILARDMDVVTIGGSIIGGHAINSGELFAGRDIGRIKVGGDLRGGDDDYNGSIVAGGSIKEVVVKGSLYGGAGNNSGGISAAYVFPGEIGKVTIGGSVFGGTGFASGTIGSHEANDVGKPVSIGTVTIGGDLVGGSADDAGSVTTIQGTLGRLVIKGSVIGGTDHAVHVDGRAGQVSIGRSVLGASIEFEGADSVTIKGSLIGANASGSGSISAKNGGILALKIFGDVRGGSGEFSGTVNIIGPNDILFVGGAVVPGTGLWSGLINIF